MTNKATVDRLAALSLQRIGASADFQKVVKNIARYKAQKDRKYVTLNEKKFMEERAEINADKEEEKQIEKMSDSSAAGIERNYYLDEAMALTVDYLQLFAQPQPNVNVRSGAANY
jgi:carboxyl-terminal processing protease